MSGRAAQAFARRSPARRRQNRQSPSQSRRKRRRARAGGAEIGEENEYQRCCVKESKSVVSAGAPTCKIIRPVEGASISIGISASCLSSPVGIIGAPARQVSGNIPPSAAGAAAGLRAAHLIIRRARARRACPTLLTEVRLAQPSPVCMSSVHLARPEMARSERSRCMPASSRRAKPGIIMASLPPVSLRNSAAIDLPVLSASVAQSRRRRAALGGDEQCRHGRLVTSFKHFGAVSAHVAAPSLASSFLPKPVACHPLLRQRAGRCGGRAW